MPEANVTLLRARTKEYFDAAEINPVAIHRKSKLYVLMSKQHYVDLLHKAKYPQLMQMPANVQTIVHFCTVTTTTTA